MDEMKIYEPLQKKINGWVWYAENKPKSEYKKNRKEHDEFRIKHELDCVLAEGDLSADTIFSLWLPLRFTLVSINHYKALNKVGDINDKTNFVKKLVTGDNLRKLLPSNHPAVIKLSKLFSLGMNRENVMILPERWLQKRGKKPYYDYMPYFLYECFSGGMFSEAFKSDEALIEWVTSQSLEAFFEGKIEKENIRDLAGTGNIKNGVPKRIEILLDNYIAILQTRNVD